MAFILAKFTEKYRMPTHQSETAKFKSREFVDDRAQPRAKHTPAATKRKGFAYPPLLQVYQGLHFRHQKNLGIESHHIVGLPWSTVYAHQLSSAGKTFLEGKNPVR